MKKLFKKIIPPFFINLYHFFLAFFGALLYRFPSSSLTVIGVTGTDGKSTTVDLISRILEEAGFNTASLSSIRFKIKEKEWPNNLKMTMPGRFSLQRFLRKAANEKCKYAVLEVSSEGLRQHRHRFIDFSIAVFTNLSPEHIESHGSFEKYRNCKGRLFKAAKKCHVINRDDENKEYFSGFKAAKKILYGMGEGEFSFSKVQSAGKGLSFSVNGVGFNTSLLGDFNAYNSLAAVCVASSEGIGLDVCKRALEKSFLIPGRMELVISSPFKVFVDYAVTPAAFEKAFKSLSLLKKGRMIAVFGSCGGGRDKWRRPVLGRIASEYCDSIIITNEDPYDEDPKAIMAMIKKGIAGGFPSDSVFEIEDRRQAIKKALSLASANDIVVITGKGSEPWICLANVNSIPGDDGRTAREEFCKLDKVR